MSETDLKLGEINQAYRRRDWYFLAGCMAFHLLYRFYLVYTSWAGRIVPLEPDDAYAYIALIKRLASFGLSNNIPALSNDWYVSNFWYIPWLALQAIPHRLFGISIETLYELNFYLGFSLLAISAAYVMIKISGPVFAGIVLVVLAFNWGIGSYFYFIVPSHYLLSLFFISWALFNSPNSSATYLFIVCVILALLIHPMGPLVIILLLAYYLIFSLITKNINRCMVNKIVAVIVFLIVCGAIYYIVGPYYDFDVFIASPAELLGVADAFTQSLYSWMGSAKPYIVGSGSDECWWLNILHVNQSQLSYINDFFLSPLLAWDSLMIIPFLIGLSALVYNRKYELPVFWFVNVLAMLLLLKTNRSDRMLLFVWPVTYMVVAYGFYWSLCWPLTVWRKRQHVDKDIKSRFLASIPPWLVAILFMMAILVGAKFIKHNHNLNMYWVSKISKEHNFSWDRTCPEELLAITNQRSLVVCQGKTVIYSFLSYGLWSRKIKSLQYIQKSDFRGINSTVYYVTNSKSPGIEAALSRFMACIGKNNTVAFDLLKSCGYFDIYSVTISFN